MGKVEAKDEDEDEEEGGRGAGKRRRTGGAGRGLEHQTERLSRSRLQWESRSCVEQQRGKAQWRQDALSSQVPLRVDVATLMIPRGGHNVENLACVCALGGCNQ